MVTHPFSPFYGKSFTYIKRIKKDGKDRLVCLDETGNSMSLLVSWTDYPAIDPYKKLIKTAGIKNVDFSFDELNMLAKLLASIKKV